MITVETIMQAQEVTDAVKIQKAPEGYLVYQVGDELPPEPESDLNPVPTDVSPRQIRQALTSVGLRASVEAAVSLGSQDLKDWWEFSTSFERNHPLVIGMAQTVGVNESQLDDLFRLADSL